jgi:hypothetical protein
MKGKYLRRLGGLLLAALLLPGVVLFSGGSAEAQRRRGRVIIVPRVRYYRPFYRPWGFGPYGPFGYYNGYYSQYVFSSADKAEDQGYHDGLKTGQGDRKHDRTYDPGRSHYYQEAGFGNFGEVYRGGFTRGYSDGYRS